MLILSFFLHFLLYLLFLRKKENGTNLVREFKGLLCWLSSFFLILLYFLFLFKGERKRVESCIGGRSRGTVIRFSFFLFFLYFLDFVLEGNKTMGRVLKVGSLRGHCAAYPFSFFIFFYNVLEGRKKKLDRVL